MAGVPFHPDGQQPRAQCPACVTEKGDKTINTLYALQGFEEGEYDPAIPTYWLDIPPMSLGGTDVASEALRVRRNLSLATHPANQKQFQYGALVNYGRGVTKQKRQLQAKLSSEKKLTAAQQKRTNNLEGQVRNLEDQVGRLEKESRHHKDFQQKKPQLIHFLNEFAQMAE